jgi:hypothetical protein
MDWKPLAFGSALLFGIGSFVGSTSQPTPEPEFIKVPHYEVIYKDAPAPPAPKPVMPESCQQAVDAAKRVTNAGSRMYAQSDEQLAILSQARFDLAAGRNTTSVDERQRALQGRTVGNLRILEESLTDIDLLNKKCAEETP